MKGQTQLKKLFFQSSPVKVLPCSMKSSMFFRSGLKRRYLNTYIGIWGNVVGMVEVLNENHAQVGEFCVVWAKFCWQELNLSFVIR